MTGDVQLPPTWAGRAAKLRRLLTDLADARYHATVLHAKTYLDAEGVATQREQEAKLAAAEMVRAAALQAAHLEAYRLLIDVARDGAL